MKYHFKFMKNFSIFKNTNKKEGSTAPDYKMSAKVGEEYVEVGACWIKDGKKGGKYMSCQLSDVYVDHTKNIARKGFMLVDEAEFGKIAQPFPEVVEKPQEDGGIPF